MKKSEADKIAIGIINDCIEYWTFENIPEGNKQEVVSIISAALVDASKVTECAEFKEYAREAWQKYSAIESSKPDLTFQRYIINALEAGQKSTRGQGVPDAVWEGKVLVNNGTFFSSYDFAEDIEKIIKAGKYRVEFYKLDAVKALNEGK